jgi:hypothetical protein
VQACCNGLLPPSAPLAHALLSMCDGHLEQHSVIHALVRTQGWQVWLLVLMGPRWHGTGSKLVTCSSHEELHLGLRSWAPPVVCISQYVPHPLTSAASRTALHFIAPMQPVLAGLSGGKAAGMHGMSYVAQRVRM